MRGLSIIIASLICLGVTATAQAQGDVCHVYVVDSALAEREYEREEDGRWLAEVLELPGVLAYGANSDEAIAKAPGAGPWCVSGPAGT